jgi:membrane-associated protease RseP (regulator of RpoE activity)
MRTWRGPRLERYIQTDATPYPGFSGGPLIDARGNVLGIMTTGLARGAAVAVPAELAWRVAKSLEERGSVRRGYLGILSQPVRLPDAQRLGLTQRGGLLVVGVEEGSPAGRGGLIIGDIVATLDGQPVEDTEDLLVLLTGQRVGREVPVDVIRGGPGEGDLRPDVGEGGPIKAIVRTAQKVLGDEDERLHVLDDALEAGHHVVTVRLTGEDDDERDAAKAALGAAMRDHGAHDVAFYGKYQIQQLDAGAT